MRFQAGVPGLPVADAMLSGLWRIAITRADHTTHR
jgi:hypothetical protein